MGITKQDQLAEWDKEDGAIAAVMSLNPFVRITYTDDERECSKSMWKRFEHFWREIESLVPSGPHKSAMIRKLQEALYTYELAHTEYCKSQRSN